MFHSILSLAHLTVSGVIQGCDVIELEGSITDGQLLQEVVMRIFACWKKYISYITSIQTNQQLAALPMEFIKSRPLKPQTAKQNKPLEQVHNVAEILSKVR